MANLAGFASLSNSDDGYSVRVIAKSHDAGEQGGTKRTERGRRLCAGDTYFFLTFIRFAANYGR